MSLLRSALGSRRLSYTLRLTGPVLSIERGLMSDSDLTRRPGRLADMMLAPVIHHVLQRFHLEADDCKPAGQA